VLAHWIVTGHPDVDVTGFNIDRLHTYQANRVPPAAHGGIAGPRVSCHYPSLSLTTARNVRKSPFHDRLAAAGAYFKEVSGWESPDWYGEPGRSPIRVH
jgi:4-methylaminobutanoate oxidase (formaldehyde-forming)